MEREATSDLEAEKQITMNSYIKQYVLAKEMDVYPNYGKWLEYTAKSKIRFFEKLSSFDTMAPEKDYSGMKLLLSIINGPWISISSDLTKLVPRLVAAVDREDDETIAETLYELNKIKPKQK